MAHDAIDIREFVEDDLEAVVAFSLRAWEPVFVSIHAVLGDEIFLRLHPDWTADQEEIVRSICMNDEPDVYECMGVIEIIGVDPDHQRRGVGARLAEFAADHMRRCGMDIAVVETGGDPGHTPARALYGDVGFTLLPIARYFRLLD
jgi:GNAT superfamily N-acetyltransferase